MVEPSKPEDWSNPKHAPEIWLEGETETMKSGASTKNTNSNTAVKSCKGLVYYSSRLKADSKNPICAGFTRSHRDLDEVSVDLGPVLIKHLPKEERTKTLSKFRVACVGYSAYSDRKGDHNFNGQETETELPGCMGFMVLMHKQPFFNKDGLHLPLKRIMPNFFMIDAIDVSASGATMSTPYIYSLLYVLLSMSYSF